MRGIIDWLEARTGCVGLARRLLFEEIPGGARWRHSWGMALLYCFFLQVVTGFFLWIGYSPSGQTAWESVYYIQHEMHLGWLLRGIHHFSAQAFVVMLVIHLAQMIFYRAYLAPRELNFWLLIILVPLAITISATGWLLPYDQKGFWASRVPMNIVAAVPVLGPMAKSLAMGGADFGHHTLTRFFAMHAGLLPPIIGALLLLHTALQRKQGLANPDPARPAQPYWPYQFAKDAVLCSIVLGAILALVMLPRWIDPDALPGVPLGAPADPSEQYSAARPEWFMLFLFQFLKAEFLTGWFGQYGELVGAFVVPGMVMSILFAMPFVARKWRKGHAFNVAFLACLGTGMVTLTAMAYREDAANATYHEAVKEARRDSERILVLAESPAGIPTSGALSLLRSDPLTQGPKLFAKHCASCHRYEGHDGRGKTPSDPQSAADLKDFGTRRWIGGLLDPERVGTTNYFGGTAHAQGKMVKWVQRNVPKYDDDERASLRKVILALSAEAQLRSQIDADQRDAAAIREGRKLVGELGCTDCHQYRAKDPEATAPDLTGYGSRDWLTGVIRNAAHPRYYGKNNDRMPKFGPDGIMTEREIGLLTAWLRGEWYEPSNNPTPGR